MRSTSSSSVDVPNVDRTPGTPGRWRSARAAGTCRTESTSARAEWAIRRRVGRECLDVAPRPLGVEHAHRERRLAGPGDAGDRDELLHGDVDIAQIVRERRARRWPWVATSPWVPRGCHARRAPGLLAEGPRRVLPRLSRPGRTLHFVRSGFTPDPRRCPQLHRLQRTGAPPQSCRRERSAGRSPPYPSRRRCARR